jgi:hypothetical protein
MAEVQAVSIASETILSLAPRTVFSADLLAGWESTVAEVKT